jgi:hypothetical protein
MHCLPWVPQQQIRMFLFAGISPKEAMASNAAGAETGIFTNKTLLM